MSLFCWPSIVWATSEVTLFEQNRNKSNLMKQESKTAVPVAKKKNNGKILNKKLIGIQRFGPQYTLIFKNKHGRQERFVWQQKDNQKPVEVEAGFTIEQVEQRLVKLKLSQQVRCEADKKQQIECPDATHMNLAIQRNKVMIKKNHLKTKSAGRNPGAQKKIASPGIKKMSQQDQEKKVKNPFLLMMQKSQEKQMPGL